MPPLSTHFRFAMPVLPSLGLEPLAGYFLLGTTAPDAFEPDSEASFSQHHFKGMDGRISLQKIFEDTSFIRQSSNDPIWAFTCGYYCHLWLDVFYRDHGDRLPFKRPAGMSDSDLRSLVRKETEVLNAPFVLSVRNLPVSQYRDMALPFGPEFVNLERCIELFYEVVKQSQAWSLIDPAFVSIDREEYAAFLENGSRSFMAEFQTAA